MLPVQVKSVSSSCCTLSEASALLQRFLSSDGCSDSFARDYVANVAQALQDSVSRRSGGPESKGNTAASPPHPHRKLHSRGTKYLLVAKKLVPSGLGDAHTDEKKSLPSAEDGDASMEDLPCASEIENSALMHHDKKRRKKEKHKTATESVIKELYGADDRMHHDRKRRKEKQEMETKILETDHPALDNRGSDGKKRRMKEEGKDMNDMETLHVPENTGSLISLSHAKKKVEVSHMDANNVRVSVMPMSGKVDELTVSWKSGKMFPSAMPSLEKEERQETDMEASPVEFENPASDEKKRTKNKRRRKQLGD